MSTEGGTYGFEQIGDCGARLEQAAGDSKAKVEIKRLTGELVRWCRRASRTATQS